MIYRDVVKSEVIQEAGVSPQNLPTESRLGINQGRPKSWLQEGTPGSSGGPVGYGDRNIWRVGRPMLQTAQLDHQVLSSTKAEQTWCCEDLCVCPISALALLNSHV